MSKQELQDIYNKAFNETTTHGAEIDTVDFFIDLYSTMWDEAPHIINLSNDGEYLNPKVKDLTYDDNDEYQEDEDDEDVTTFNRIQYNKTIINLVNHYKDTCIVTRILDKPIIIGDHFLVFFNDRYQDLFVLQNSDMLSDEFISLVIDNQKTEEDKCRYFTYVTSSTHGYNETPLKIKKFDIDLVDNYNDDLPDKKIKDFLKGKRSGLILLYGNPGTGKTYYIRHLIKDIKRPFIVLDASMFNSITDASFIELLLENRNAVVILEDCEDMLADRLVGNAKISTLLNLSDGIIGDSFNFKFICTFNAKISKLDKALLRKGRLFLQYEFKPLTAEKTQNLAKKLNIDIPDGASLPLTEIFNYNHYTGETLEQEKIGFKPNKKA